MRLCCQNKTTHPFQNITTNGEQHPPTTATMEKGGGGRNQNNSNNIKTENKQQKAPHDRYQLAFSRRLRADTTVKPTSSCWIELSLNYYQIQRPAHNRPRSLHCWSYSAKKHEYGREEKTKGYWREDRSNLDFLLQIVVAGGVICGRKLGEALGNVPIRKGCRANAIDRRNHAVDNERHHH